MQNIKNENLHSVMFVFDKSREYTWLCPKGDKHHNLNISLYLRIQVISQLVRCLHKSVFD
jgi:hypothetical protein